MLLFFVFRKIKRNQRRLPRPVDLLGRADITWPGAGRRQGLPHPGAMAIPASPEAVCTGPQQAVTTKCGTTKPRAFPESSGCPGPPPAQAHPPGCLPSQRKEAPTLPALPRTPRGAHALPPWQRLPCAMSACLPQPPKGRRPSVRLVNEQELALLSASVWPRPSHVWMGWGGPFLTPVGPTRTPL